MNVQAVGKVLLDMFRCRPQRLGGVITVFGFRSVKPEVHPVGGHFPGMILDKIMNAQGGVVTSQNFEHLLAQPFLVPKFDGPSVSCGRFLEKSTKPWRIRVPVGRKLNEERA
jgi:hypothetical protein